MLQLDPKKVYKLVAVTDKNGTDKVNSRSLYKERINCLATNLRYDEKIFKDKTTETILCVDFIQDEEGKWINRHLNTSPVYKVVEVENGIDICTLNSIYTFIEAEMIPPVYQDEANLIELYLSRERDDRFIKGFYYDEDKVPHELAAGVHLGMFVDSVLMRFVAEEDQIKYLGSYACRYFIRYSGIEFYDTIYGQQAYPIDILIHNVGNYDMEVKVEFLPEEWVVPVGESKRLPSFDELQKKHREEKDTADGTLH